MSLDDLAAGPPDRLWVVTPWSAGTKLPRFEDGQGVEALLGHVARLHLTGLPVAHVLQGPAPSTSTRAALRDGQSPRAMHLGSIGGVPIVPLGPSPPTPAPALTCYVAAGLDDGGVVREVRHGPGSVVVTP
ncbi:MAG: hypothetical protein M9894_14240 [Planctomycetes bacterium]|nr:hypothetical protein [Planctomycetota bacterium]